MITVGICHAFADGDTISTEAAIDDVADAQVLLGDLAHTVLETYREALVAGGRVWEDAEEQAP